MAEDGDRDLGVAQEDLLDDPTVGDDGRYAPLGRLSRLGIKAVAGSLVRAVKGRSARCACRLEQCQAYNDHDRRPAGSGEKVTASSTSTLDNPLPYHSSISQPTDRPPVVPRSRRTGAYILTAVPAQTAARASRRGRFRLPLCWRRTTSRQGEHQKHLRRVLRRLGAKVALVVGLGEEENNHIRASGGSSSGYADAPRRIADAWTYISVLRLALPGRTAPQ